MSEARVAEPAWRLWIASALGLWAAAVALAPDLKSAALLSLPLLVVALGWWTILAPARWVTLFFATALLLPPLPVRLGDTGPHVAVAVAALGLFAGLLRLPEWRIRADGLTRALLVYFFVLLASVSLAAFYSGPVIAAGTLARVLLFGIAVYLFFYTAYGPGAREGSDPSRTARALFWIAAASALFACLDFYFQFPAPAGFGPQFVWLDSGVYRRAQGLFYEASTLGNFCVFFLVMIAAALSRPPRESPVSRAGLLTGGAIFSAALVFSYSRASLLNLIAASLALLFLHRRRLRLRRLAAALLIAIGAGVALGYAFFPAFVRLYWLNVQRSVQYFFSATEGVLSGRLESWRTLGQFLAENPWHALAGIGYKTLPYTSFAGHPVIADNMYLSMLVETGLIGLAALIALNLGILWAARRAARSPRASFFGTWIFCFWIGQLFQMLSGDLLTYWRVLPVYFWVLAVAVRESTQAPAS
ncbi:MAG: O-antigen ligase family protein [Acidobacteriota bacterium]